MPPLQLEVRISFAISHVSAQAVVRNIGLARQSLIGLPQACALHFILHTCCVWRVAGHFSILSFYLLQRVKV